LFSPDYGESIRPARRHTLCTPQVTGCDRANHTPSVYKGYDCPQIETQKNPLLPERGQGAEERGIGVPSDLISKVLMTALMAGAAANASAQPQFAWRYYRPGNTGIQGDYCESLWLPPDGNPWVGGYDASFEEGGIAQLIHAENRWINISNIDYPEIGHPDNTGVARVSDITADSAGRLWMATGHGALFFDPAIGPASLRRFDENNSGMPGGWCEDVDIAPDGTVWFGSRATVWGWFGVSRYNPATDQWTTWDLDRDNLTIRPTPTATHPSAYTVIAAGEGHGNFSHFNSVTQTWSTPAYTGAPGQVAALPGKDATDEQGHTWARRATTPGMPLRLARQAPFPSTTWLVPPEPYPGFGDAILAFRALSGGQALLADGAGRVWRFDGASWIDYGVWREGTAISTYSVAIHADGAVWASGVGGMSRRDPATGQWQRYRITNSANFDSFNNDLDVRDNIVYACANAGPGAGGMVSFDGQRWTGFNQLHYGLGHDWPFHTDNSECVFIRADGQVAVNPMFNGVSLWNGSSFSNLLSSTTVRDFAEDSLGRLWYIGEYFNIKRFDGTTWQTFGITGWGGWMHTDPSRAGTVWAAASHEIVRTDGTYRFSRLLEELPELDPQSDTFSGLAVAPDGVAWIGAWTPGTETGALIRVDSTTGQHTVIRAGTPEWPFPGQYVSPLAVTPDGRLWMQYDSEYLVARRGLCAWDGNGVIDFPAPSFGEPQWGGLPHASIKELVVRDVPGGYELWMSCISRGIAVLSVTTPPCPSDVNGDTDSDVLDFLDFIDSFGACENQPSPCAGSSGVNADFNADTTVDILDFLDFFDAFGTGCD
jgi:hypothetical protein